MAEFGEGVARVGAPDEVCVRAQHSYLASAVGKVVLSAGFILLCRASLWMPLVGTAKGQGPTQR